MSDSLFAARPAVAARGRAARSPISLVRVQSAIARTAAGFGIAFMLQSIPAMAEQLPNMHPAWSIAIVGALVASLLWAAVASVIRVRVRSAHMAFAFTYLVALFSWPWAVLDVAAAPESSYWLYYILTVATAMATVGFDIRIAIVYVIVVPLLYGAIRVSPAGGDVTYLQAALDSVYAIILGGAMTTITAILRTAARAVDRAQATALERYSHAVREHATEAERVQVDAIVHDSVLTTLLSAARAQTPEAKALAARMAGNAIGYLRRAVAVVPQDEDHVSLTVLAGRIADAGAALSEPVQVDDAEAGSTSIPVGVAEAVYSAAVQAMVNSLQHAGAGVERWVRLRADGGGVTVEVGDRGSGFDPETIPTGRLGVRVSILERVTGVGGEASIESAPGKGTIVRLRWPAAPVGAADAALEVEGVES